MSHWVTELIVTVFIVLLGIIVYNLFKGGITDVGNRIFSGLRKWVKKMDSVTAIDPDALRHPIMAARLYMAMPLF